MNFSNSLLKWPALNNQFSLNVSQEDISCLYERDYGFYLENMYSLNTTCVVTQHTEVLIVKLNFTPDISK